MGIVLIRTLFHALCITNTTCLMWLHKQTYLLCQPYGALCQPGSASKDSLLQCRTFAVYFRTGRYLIACTCRNGWPRERFHHSVRDDLAIEVSDRPRLYMSWWGVAKKSHQLRLRDDNALNFKLMTSSRESDHVELFMQTRQQQRCKLGSNRGMRPVSLMQSIMRWFHQMTHHKSGSQSDSR